MLRLPNRVPELLLNRNKICCYLRLKVPSAITFPKEAKKEHVEGEVSFSAVVQADGTLNEISDLTGPELLVKATLESLPKWRFNPATRNSQPIAARLRFAIRYERGNVQMHETPLDPANYTQTRIRVSQAILQSLRTKSVIPQSPGARGTVVMEVIVGTDGRVRHVKVLQGSPSINSAAEDAVRQWQYKPYLINGVPLGVESQVTINFNPY